jgi:mannose-6-phosphate isomerase class I
MGGTNLSCQVHPRVDYIREEFGEPFTQHETYYVMQADPGARVYLGLREDIDPAAFRKAAELAQRDGTPFEIAAHVHSIPSSEHDLFLIPAGTVHCSGAGNLVLEISATPYIYTFKISDYLRKDLTGHLRQVFVDRAFANIDFTRRARWINDHLKPLPRLIREDAGAGEYVIADLPQLFFRIHRLEFENQISDVCNGRFLVLNLVAGERVDILHGSRRTELRYAETLIVPASVGEFQVVNKGNGPCKIVKAFIR